MAFLLALLAPMMSAWAGGGGTTTYNYSASVSVAASGNGTVYVGQSETANDKTKKSDSQSVSGSEATSQTFTFWAFAEPEPGYEFGGWSEGADSVGSATSKVTVSLSSSAPNKDVKLTATFNKVLTFDGDEYIIDENGGDLATLLGTVKEGDKIIIKKDVEIAKGVALTIPAGVQVSVSSGKKLIVKGGLTIHADARLVGDGTLAHNWKTITQQNLHIPFPLGTDGVAGTGAGINTIDGTAGKYLVTSVAEANDITGSFTCKEEFFVAVENKASGETYYSKPSTSKPVGVLCTVAREKALNWIDDVSEEVYTDYATLLSASATTAASKTHEVKDTNKLSVLLADAGTVTYDGTSTSSSSALGFAVDLASTSITLTTGKQWNSLKLVRFFNGSVTVKKKVMNTNFCVYNCSGTFDYLSGSSYYTAISFYDSPSVKVSWDDLTTETPAGGQNYYGGGTYNTTNAKFQTTPTTKFNTVYWGTFAKGMATNLAKFKEYLYNTNEVDAEQDSSQNYVVKAKIVDPNVGQVLLNGEESTFANAIANAPANAKIVLQRDVEIPSDLTLTVTGVQIDLGGFKLTGSNAIINNGDLEIIDANGNGQIDVPVINNGTLLLSSAKYNGPITLNSGFCYFLDGTFNGGITVASSVEDAKSVAEVCGGTYATLTYAHGGQNGALVDLCENGYVKDNAIAPTPVSYVTNPSFASYSLSAFDSTTESLYKRNAARSGYTREEWIKLCKLKSASALFSDFGVDCAVTFDRAIAANDVSVTAMGIYPFDIDEAIAANKSFSALFQAMRRSGMATAPWTYGTILPGGEHDGKLSFSLSNKSAQDGTLCLVEMRLATGIRNMSGPKDWSYTEYVTTAKQKLLLGNTNGDKAMIRPETGAATFYATLGAAMDAAADGGTVMLANDCGDDLELKKAGTYTFDTMGFAFTGEVKAGTGLKIASQTSDDSSAKLLVSGAVATTYVVEQSAVAMVDETPYESLAEAVAAANGAVVTLVADSSETITLAAGQTLKLAVADGAAFGGSVVSGDATCHVDSSVADGVTTYSLKAIVAVLPPTGEVQGAAVSGETAPTAAEVESAVESLTGNTTISKVDSGVASVNEVLTGGNQIKEVGVTPVSVTLETVDGVKVVKAATFDVKPVDMAGNAVTALPEGKSLKFRLPVDANARATKTRVFHGEEQLDGLYAVATSGGEKYVELSAGSFSPYGYELLEITADMITVENVLYDGTAQEPTVIVKDGETKLVLGTDYTVSYSNNNAPGTGTVTVTGAGNYAGSSATKNFKIGLPVAQIGETKYETLADAIADANDGDTVQLLADVDMRSYFSSSTTRFPISKSLAIDGQGHSITVGGRGFGVGMNATSNIDVTFKDVTIANSSANARCIDTRGNLNSLTLDNAKLLAPNTGTQPLTIGGNQATAATVAIKNGSVVQTKDDGSSGYAIITFNPVNMTIEDSTIKGWACIYAKGSDGSAGSAGSVFTIAGSELVSKNVHSGQTNAFSMLTAEDDNVTFNITNTEIDVSATGDQPQAIVGTSGSRTGVTANLGEGNEVTFSGEATFALNSGNPVVSGGIFNVEVPEDVCAEGMIPATLDAATGKYGVKQGAYVAQIVRNDEVVAKYETLAAAIADAQDGDTVTLLKNVELTDRLFVNAGATPAYAGSNNRYATTSEDKAITLDMNGKDITSASNIALAGGSLNITGEGKISTTTDGLAPIEVRGTGSLANKRTLTIGSGVTLVGGSYGLNVFGSNDTQKNLIDVTVDGTVNGTLFVLGNLKNTENAINIVVNGTVAAKGGTSEDVNVGIALNGNANVTMNSGASVSGDSGIEVRAGSLTVNGGKITATASEYSYNANNSGCTTKGAAIAVAQHGTALATAVTLNGGTLSGKKTIGVTDVNGNMDNVSVVATQGYTQSSAIPDGYKWVETATAGVYTLAPKDYVAQIVRGGEVVAKYETLAAAIADAQDGDTVQLLADIEDFTGMQVIAKSLTLDGAGYTITAGASADGEEMFDVAGDVNVTITDLTIDGAHKYTYCVQAYGDGANLMLNDVTILHGTKVWIGDFKYGAGVHVNDAHLTVSGAFTAFSGGKTDASFPFTGILYEGGTIQFADGATASIANPEDATDTDLLLVGKVGAIDVSDPADKAEVEAMLAGMNIPAGYYPYTLKINPDEWSSGFEQNTSFTGASPLGWNAIIDYGKAIMTAVSIDTAETPVEVGLLADTVLPDTFKFEDSNFSVNGNGNALSGTIEYTDNAGLIHDIELGTADNALVLDMRGVGKPIEIGSGIMVENVIVKMTPEQATAGTPVIIWDVEHGVDAPENESGVTVALVDAQGTPTGDTAELTWDDELGMAYIGPCEARLTGPTHDKPIYTSLANAIALAAQSDDTVTLLMDIAGFSGTQKIEKSLTLDGDGHKITAASTASSTGAMFDVRGENVAFTNLTINGDHRYWYCVEAHGGNLALQDMTILNGAQRMVADDDENPQVGYGSAVHVNGANLSVSGTFKATGGGKEAGVFPFTEILYSNGTIHFEDDVVAEIGGDLLLVGFGPLNVAEYLASADVAGVLEQMNIPDGYIPYSLTLGGSNSDMGFIGASPRTWNTIVDYGKEIMDVATESGIGGFDMDPETTPAEVGLMTDTVIPGGGFTYQDANFSVNGNGNALSGTIVFKDEADGGMLRGIALGKTENALVLDLRQTTKPIDLGAGVEIDNVVVLMTEEQASKGKVVFDWDAAEITGDDIPAHADDVVVTIVNAAGESSGDPKTVEWDEEQGLGYIGPCEARLTGPTHDAPIYTTLANAIALAAESGDTVTLLMDISLTDRLFVNAGATPTFDSKNRYATTSENKSITLDMNGFDITSSSNIALAGGSLNITGNGTISTTNDGLAPVEVRGSGDLASKRTLTIGKDVVLDGGSYGLNVFGSNSAQKNLIDVTVNGTVNGTLFVLGNLTNADNEIKIVVNGTVAAGAGTAENVSVGIALNGNANVTVNSPASVSGESGIEVRAGSLTVNGGTITATASDYSYNPTGNGCTTKGAAVAVAQHGTLLPTSVLLNGGSLVGEKSIGVTDVNNNMDDVSVVATEGYTMNSSIPFGYEWVETETEGFYTLDKMTCVVQIVGAATGAIELSGEIPVQAGQSLTYYVSVDGGQWSAIDTLVIPADALPASGTYATLEYKAVITEGTKSVDCEIVGKVGILHVKDDACGETTIVGVPWLPFGEKTTVDSLVYLGNRSDDDEIMAYDADAGIYRSWYLKNGSWKPYGTSGGTPVVASEVVVVRGHGFRLYREDVSKPIYLIGRAPEAEEAVDAATVFPGGTDASPAWTLAAAPSNLDLDLNGEGSPFESRTTDTIVVMTPQGVDVPYTFENGKWGCVKSVEKKRPSGATYWVTERVNEAVIPAGIGFWYVNSGSELEVEW